MSDNNKPTVFDRHSAKAPILTLIPESEQTGGKQHYDAFERDDPNTPASRIRLEFGDAAETTCILAKHYLIEIISSGDSQISLIFTTAAFALEGENLHCLHSDLDAENIQLLRCYNPTIHLPPAKGQPVIMKMHRLAFEGDIVPLVGMHGDSQE